MNNVEKTINMIMDFYINPGQKSDKKIDEWFQSEPESADLFVILCEMLSENGWIIEESFLEYQNGKMKVISQELYDRAMQFYRG